MDAPILWRLDRFLSLDQVWESVERIALRNYSLGLSRLLTVVPERGLRLRDGTMDPLQVDMSYDVLEIVFSRMTDSRRVSLWGYW
jgi:hypothetical protein